MLHGYHCCTERYRVEPSHATAVWIKSHIVDIPVSADQSIQFQAIDGGYCSSDT